jgi:UDP-GlcNAc:undecaprenyl-phosphate GlcNAc-1-phosphate transferase
LAAGIAGFLPFNYPRARIFMGDVGSQVCGFLVADLALQAAGSARLSLIVPLASAPVLADVAFTLVRRALAGAQLTQAHRGHLYQVANRAGHPAWLVTLVYWCMSAWGGLAGLAAAAWPYPSAGLLGAIAAALLPFGVWGAVVARSAKRAGLTAW